MMKNKNIIDYTDKLNCLIKEMKESGLSLQTYETRIENNIIEKGVSITDGKEISFIQTWKMQK